MEVVVIVLFTLIVVGVVLWLYVRDRKPDKPSDEPVEPSEPDMPEPVEPDIPEIPEDPEDPDIPEEPGEPDIPDIPEPVYNQDFEECLLAFCDYVEIDRDSVTYNYLKKLYDEAEAQWQGKSLNNIPILKEEKNFPILYDWGKWERGQSAFDTLIGWLIALQLSELKPYDRTALFKIGYEYGGYDKYSSLYIYSFDSDPNNARLIAATIYAAMRGIVKPDIEAMRNEIGGTKYNKTLAVLADDKRDNVKPEDFFIDFREFMSSAPGPYAPGYTDRPDNPFPYEERDEYGNLKIDREIHEQIVQKYNLDSTEYRQETVQAIADKEGEAPHLFGYMRTTKHYHFNPVFGKEYIGITIDPEGAVADLAIQAQAASNSARGILQSANVSPKQYGRLRPGCSWQQEACKNSATDDRRNVLANFEIEDGDGCPTGYYDENGNWVIQNGVSTPEEFEELSKRQLYANSYPSGHSSGIWGVAMALIELKPKLADKVMYAANRFSLSRSIARYHWTSDIINGRVLGTAQNAVAHAASDYDDLLEKAREE